MQNISEKTDSEHLKSLLHSMTEELSLNFLERRGKNKNHKATILEELQDVITELTHRERDLQAAAGIALMMVERNDRLQEKLNKSKMKLMNALEKMHHQSIDIKTLQDSLVNAENKNDQLNKTLVETEELMLINSAELNRIVRERFKEANVGVSDEEIEMIKKDFKSQLDSIQKKRLELEKENKKILELNKIYEIENNDARLANERLEIRLNKLVESYKENELARCRQIEEIESLEMQLKVLNSNYQRLKLHCDRLEEEISIMEIRDQEPSKTERSLGTSLQSELEGMNDSFDLIQPALTQEDLSVDEGVLLKPKHHHSQTPDTRTSSLMSYFRMFSTVHNNSINISPVKIQRKKPPEEYFLLAAQAVKMNSPHMDFICSVPTQDLYEKALKEGIPFHKWHLWIESQINVHYVQSLYKKSRKNIWKRYSHKICL